jgi:hypothetical protein
VQATLNKNDKDPSLYQFFNDMTGYASDKQKNNTKAPGIDTSEGIFEAFENAIWNGAAAESLNGMTGGYPGTRSAIGHQLNGFDIYVSFGDFSNDLCNHTIVKLENVHLTTQGLAVRLDDQPVQEVYGFLARKWV